MVIRQGRHEWPHDGRGQWDLCEAALTRPVQAGVPMSISNVHPKISREFSLRLDQLRPRDKVRAIVMLRPESNGAGNAISGARRPTRADRQSKAEKISQSAESALPEIDEILEKFNGQRLAEHP